MYGDGSLVIYCWRMKIREGENVMYIITGEDSVCMYHLNV